MSDKIKAIRDKAGNLINNMSVKQLCEVWDIVDSMKTTDEVRTVRGFLLDEFEKRDPVKLEAWLDSKEDSPKNFFL